MNYTKSIRILIGVFFMLVLNHLHGQENVQVVTLNMEESYSILQYEKLELGVRLNANISNKITRFVEKKPGETINPFLEWEIKVTGVFHHLETDSIIEVDGFYFESYDSYMKYPLPKPYNGKLYSDTEYERLGGYHKRNHDYSFHIRFAPPIPGKWEYTVRVKTKSDTSFSEKHFFEVSKSIESGYVTVSQNGRFFAKNNKSFVPIGCNMPWPFTMKEFDPQFAKYNVTEDGKVLPEFYRPTLVKPRVYKTFRETMTDLAKGGANSFRMIMYPSSTDIEWEALGDYSKRMSMALELDSILECAEDNDLFIHWNLQIHYSFQTSEHAYWTRWTWDNKIDGHPFCYSVIPGIEHDYDFFKNEIAKKYYKQRLRYILARWGYSTNISLLELFSEISNVGTREADANNFYNSGDNWKIFTEWQWEMAKYIKSHHNGRIHLLTGSFAGVVNENDNIYLSPDLDIMAANVYDFGAPSFSHDYWNKTVAGEILNEVCDNRRNWNMDCKDGKEKLVVKPLFLSESGPVFAESACPNNQTETNRFLWQSLFSGVAGAFSWNSWTYKSNYYVFGQANEYISRFNLGTENWHPGASELVHKNGVDKWVYNEKYAYSMDSKFAPNRVASWKKRTRKADIAYLRSEDGTKAIGVITNKTFNLGSIDSCYVWDGLKETPLHTPEKVNCKKERLKLRGMNSGKYEVRYYRIGDYKNPVFISKDRGSNVKIEFEIEASKEEYIILFEATRL